MRQVIEKFWAICLATLVSAVVVASTATAQSARDVAAIHGAFAAMADKDWAQAQKSVKSASTTAKAIVEWHRLRAGHGTFRDYETFMANYGDWPGLPYLQKFGEDELTRSVSAARVRNYFDGQAPQTGWGALAFARALRDAGKTSQANAEIVRAWTEFSLGVDEQAAFLAGYGKVLKKHHTARLDMLLWRGFRDQSRAMYPFVSQGWQKLAEARIGLRQSVDGVDGLIAAVPANLANDPGMAYERFAWRARKNRSASAIELLLAQGTKLGEADRWASRRRSMARAEMRAGRYKNAYRLAANHGLTEGSDYSDLEWLAGYIALRFRNDPKTALKHFDRFQAAVFTPISLGRAGYWRGRAFEAMNRSADAKAAYGFGAKYQTSFYGQLAAEKIGAPMDPLMAGGEKFPAWNKKSTVFEAGKLLAAAGQDRLAARFMAHLAESLSRTERGSLAHWAIRNDEPYMALQIAKRAAQYGDMIHAPYFPLHPLAKKKGLPVTPELALSIARRESEFNASVISHAGARGLMQVMPGTAKDVAKDLGIAYSRGKLTSDWTYNATLGAAYLHGLNQEFGGNIILVSSGYNAGPGRPRRWVKSWGDPRSSSVDVVDWIEHISIRETRNYVMRVSESLGPYRARLTGKTGKIRLTRDLGSR